MVAIVKVRWTPEGKPKLILTKTSGEIIDELICIPNLDTDWVVGDSREEIEIESVIDRAIQTPEFE